MRNDTNAVCERCKGGERKIPSSFTPTQEMTAASRREVAKAIKETGYIFRSSDWLKRIEAESRRKVNK